MAKSKCPHCDGTHFELKTFEARGARYQHNFIQCAGCGAPFGVLEYQNVGALFEKQEVVLKQLQASLQNLDHRLYSVEQLLRSR